MTHFIDATRYCECVMEIANVTMNSLFDEETAEPSDNAVPTSTGAGTDIHAAEPGPAQHEKETVYAKTASLEYSESLVFAYLKSMYETVVNSDAYSSSEYDDNIELHAVFGYVIFARQSNVPETLTELLTLIRERDDEQASAVEDVQAASNTIHSEPSHDFSLITKHIQNAVALQHFMQNTIMFPAQYVKNACIQLVTTYVQTIIRGVFYTTLTQVDYTKLSACQTRIEQKHDFTLQNRQAPYADDA